MPRISFSALFVVVITFVILTLNITPLVIHIRHSPADRQFSLIHNNVQDFYFYQALMNRGASGDWLTQDPFTSEPHQPSVIFSYFVWLGKVSKLFGLPYAITYHIIRFLAGAFFFFVSYQLIRLLQIPHKNLAFFFFVFAAPLMMNDAPFMNWWTGMDPVRRAAYLPHHMIGAISLITSIILILKYVNNRSSTEISKIKYQKSNIKSIIAASLLVPLLAFIHTPSLFILLLILPPTLFIYFLRKLSLNFHSKNFHLKQFIGPLEHWNIGTLIFWLIGLISLLIMFSQTNRGFPWTQYIEWEKTLQFPLASDLPAALGILFPFALMGTIVSLFSKRFERILVACWFIVPILFIPLAPRLGISNIRLIQGVPYLPLAILSTIGISATQRIFSKFLISNFQFLINFKSQMFKNLKNKNLDLMRNFELKIKNYYVPVVVLIVFIGFTYPTIVWSVKDQIREYWTQYSNVYLDKRLFDAFAFINVTFPKNTITLSTFYTGNYLPVYTPTRSYMGHSGYTAHVSQKEPQVTRFFKGEMKEEEAKSLLVDNKITLVFAGPDEKSLYGGSLYPTLLTPIYNQDAVTIYVLKMT